MSPQTLAYEILTIHGPNEAAPKHKIHKPPNTRQAVRNIAACRFVGDHTDGVTPVPIPNTAVKPIGPMIVPLVRKSVIAGILQPDALEIILQGVFSCASSPPPKTIAAFFAPLPCTVRTQEKQGRETDRAVLRFDGFAA